VLDLKTATVWWTQASSDLMNHQTAFATVVPQNAWNGKLIDLTDVVETQKSQYHPTAILSAKYYNNVVKERGYYYVPDRATVPPFHIWNSLVEKAGYKVSDAQKTWDAFWDFFKPMQKKMRDKGIAASMRWASRRRPTGRPTATHCSTTS
jgi:multiple sugar transport system substrate-binding protein